MFMGHYSAALVAKAAEPRAPLWTYVAAAQLLDIGWSVLVMSGVERVRIDESLPGAPLDLYHMPWTHSLPAALCWALGAALLGRWALKLPWRAGVAIGLVVLSHWLLDLLVHRPDLALWGGGPKLGLSLWNTPVISEVVETGLLGLAAAAWTARRVRAGLAAWPALAFFSLLLIVQVISKVLPLPNEPVGLGLTMLGVFIPLTVVAAVGFGFRVRPATHVSSPAGADAKSFCAGS